jgi:cell division protein FtsI (penicillin-binding protein 3)/stage V sporulation protein D (sporulation-specific penicillin-binding protein)
VRESETFYCGGRVRIADGTVTDIKAHGSEILQDLIVNSCNVGMAQIGIRFRPRFAYDNLRQWGFSDLSGIELPAEETGLVSTPEQWRGVVPANIAIGQGIGVTPLQLVAALSAVINGGRCVRPFIVKEAKDGTGKVVYRGEECVKNIVISKKTSDWVRAAMRRVVTNGTGKAANSPHVAVGGKTGTAQVAERGKYVKGRFVASFVGFWPADDPDHILLVVLGEPSQKGHLGGAIAAPAFRAILEESLLLAR